MATENLFDTQLVSASLSYFAVDGVTPAPVPAGSTNAWNLVDPDGTLAMVVAADGNSAQLTTTGKDTVGSGAVLTVTTTFPDASSISDSATILVIALPVPNPASMKIVFGTPSNR